MPRKFAPGGLFVAYNDMTPEQQQEVYDHLQTQMMKPEHFYRYMFWVKPGGHVTRGKGYHEFTPEYAAQVNKEIKRVLCQQVGDPSKGGIDHHSTATFHFAPERS